MGLIFVLYVLWLNSVQVPYITSCISKQKWTSSLGMYEGGLGNRAPEHLLLQEQE